MKAKFVLYALLILLLIPITVSAKQTSPLDKLDQISDESLQMVKSKRYEDANKLLLYFKEQLSAFKMGEKLFTMDELRLISVAHEDVLKATIDEEMLYEERVKKATKFRLIIDALHSTHQPLWAEMEDSVMTSLAEVQKAVENGNNGDFHENFNSFLSMYEMIYPSMKLNIETEQIQQVEARVHFIDNYRSQVLEEPIKQKELVALQSDLDSIFSNMSEDEADPSLWWVIISTGSIIIVTLTYVGWRKYRGDKRKAKNRSRELKD